MRKTAKLNDNAYLRPDGSNLPAFLYLLQQKYPDSYSLIRRTTQLVAPFFDDFQFEPDPLQEDQFAWSGNTRILTSILRSSLSDGTFRFIALALFFYNPKHSAHPSFWWMNRNSAFIPPLSRNWRLWSNRRR